MMSVLFGYMSFLIIIKWLTFWKNTGDAPSIIAFMINIFLKQGTVIGSPLVGSKDFNEKLNIGFLITAVLCVPLMLLVKPLHTKFTSPHHEEEKPKKEKLKKSGYSKFEDEEDEEDEANTPH